MKKNITISSSIVAVSYEGVTNYINNEIIKEGKWRNDVSLVTILPLEKRQEDSNSAIKWALQTLSKACLISAPELIEVDDESIDVGLIDIQVYFQGNQRDILKLLKQDSAQFFTENAKHLDYLLGENIHDQMILMNAFHMFNTKGETSIHYHNVVFGARVQGSQVGMLDLEPLLKCLSQNGKSINFVVPIH